MNKKPSYIINFPEGLPGFEEIKEYELSPDEEVPFVMTLKSIHAEHPSFIVVDPYCILESYNPLLSDSDKKFFNTTDKLKFMLMAVLTDNIKDSVVNMKSPIVINPENNLAKQVILENTDYPIRHNLFGDFE